MFAYRYLAGVAQESTEPILLRIAEEVDLSHSLLARIVLERHLSHTRFQGENCESIMSGFNRHYFQVPKALTFKKRLSAKPL